MKRVRLIRHGQGAANAGQASRDHASIALTPLGLEQARMIAGSFSVAPDLIVASPFARAQVTAQATAATFPGTPFETWAIEEFTYLAPERCVDTTVAQRKSWVDAYWLKSDPAYRDGAGAESFHDFVARAQAFMDRLEQHPAGDIAVFSHGQYLNAVAWLLERKPQFVDGQAMSDWRTYEINNHIQNGAGFSLSKGSDEALWTFARCKD